MKTLLPFLLLAASLQAQAPPQPSPRISIDPMTFDFGEIRGGKAIAADKVVDKEFAVRNFGAAELRISGVSTTCGCTLVGTYPKSLKPGEAGSFHVQIRLHDLPAGKILKTVLVKSNDPAKPITELRLQATVVEAAGAD